MRIRQDYEYLPPTLQEPLKQGSSCPQKEKYQEELKLATVVAKDLDHLNLSTFPRMFGGDVRGRQGNSALLRHYVGTTFADVVPMANLHITLPVPLAGRSSTWDLLGAYLQLWSLSIVREKGFYCNMKCNEGLKYRSAIFNDFKSTVSLVNKLHVAPNEKYQEVLKLATVVAKELDHFNLSTFPRIFGGDVRGREGKSARLRHNVRITFSDVVAKETLHVTLPLPLAGRSRTWDSLGDTMKIFLRLYRHLVNKVLHVAPKEKYEEELNLATVAAEELDQLNLSTLPRMFGGDFRGRQDFDWKNVIFSDQVIVSSNILCMLLSDRILIGEMSFSPTR
ncbi:hypothetical protein ANN_06899 [Periplaneta americana]|uniref:Uncharacterized protein n=1 Tax=Periplaneta americana TaxID=6978 RepID=A0ABQ8TGX4_PERAM|nr:hypothetical protein ANN_06899 [Periplaneta americana]